MSLSEQERVDYRAAHGMHRRQLPAWAVGLIATVAALGGLYLAFVKHIPFTGHGYTVHATFANAVNVQPGNPVRIAGINVGEVLGTERDGNNTTVTFNVDDEAAPINSDAMIRIRPRIFFEGSYFLELRPGSPSAPELPSGGTIPISHTATAVQFDEVLGALREPIRDDLGRLLAGYGTALTHVPTPAEDIGFEPEVQGKSAGEALNMAFDYGAQAGKTSSRVAQAFLGTEPDDLSRLVSASGRAFDALGRDEAQLQNLVSNWNTFTGALASQSDNLSATIAKLPPTLDATDRSLGNLNSTLPVLRAWSRSFEPSLAELPAFIDAANPWLAQAQPLLSRSEAGGLVTDLRKATPGLTGAARHGIDTLREISLLSRCASEVLIPAGDQEITDQFSTGGPNYREFFYAAANIAGESQNFDGNGPILRLTPSIGDQAGMAINPNPYRQALKDDKHLWTNMTELPTGSQPQLGGMPPFKPTVPCHTNDVPDLNSGLGEVGPPTPKASTPPGP